MIYRVIHFTVPALAVRHVAACGCIIRSWDTPFRGPVAFVGLGQVWAVADLESTAATSHGKTPGYLWSFAKLRLVEGVACGRYGVKIGPGCTDRMPNKPEPVWLNAGAQAALEAMFPESVPVALPLIVAPVEAAYIEVSGQCALF